MKVMKIKVYSYDELSNSAKRKSLDNVYNSISDLDIEVIREDFRNTLKEFNKVFGIVRYDRGSLYLVNSYRNLEINGLRLRTFILNNFDEILHKPKFIATIKNEDLEHKRLKNGFYYSAIQKTEDFNLTGVYSDYYVLESIYNFIKKPDNYTTYEDLMLQCLDNLENGMQKCIDGISDEDYLLEYIKNNDIVFWENGDIFV